MIEVVRPGPLATVQDLGRPGRAHLGVPRSGAADEGAFRLANRLVGNPEGSAGVEFTFGGAALRFRDRAWVAVTGAPVPVRIDGRACGTHAPCHVRDGAVLELGTPSAGLRSYLAVRGGVGVDEVLGSRSTDLLSCLGPAPLSPGDRLPVGSVENLDDITVDVAPAPPLPEIPVLRIIPGPRDDWFTEDAMVTLTSKQYEVSPDSNRVGVRLDGPPLVRARDGELGSEGMVTGSLQVPPSGMPIIFLSDHPTTGGYPVVAVLASAAIDVAAQLRPGQKLRFRL
ncbi:biotin-dependent carboxyltransferase family protein [Actinomadura madurae]|uniref:5-oxoprolinase subunit C family protein n=1 Tax=Actinomadura madurae TaxID=1993 RepID=UPI0020D2531C|nr:biotin-dependent carboxyltransferase family protein [Actinomadura madurae]MCP9949452.1 biotin-dependent carboxyltransferase family protein [Actinomadura madurae]MCP9966205.1 biotin-dependent carboxyltransferase family protein [Actinomadura madurae]MCQ0009781.1 biotin-dependent carboxyltransferase family protein [Actinomadura madurae]MCQ0014894.1 biotin-dependent carboxyltransferase family protein [Actinomadura madurae]